MEISNTTAQINAGIAPTTKPATAVNNAFGIGQANQPEVELSAQAKILQQSEQQSASRTNNTATSNAQNDAAPVSSSDFIRVSSSIGKATQSNGLTEKEALELYRSIEKLV